MIRTFRSKALSRYWTKADSSGLRPDWIKRIRLVLSRLDAASIPQEMDLPGLGLHALVGDQTGRFSVTVSRNWRMTFAFDGEDAVDVDLEDYHG
ncbi:peptidase [Kaistia algarum]|uniref:type II toxin-antitoxin system RelE/ParE family toxin n=1 Tax=Kaistia algarum TaxID=2083279 RepID=UPI000CE8829D|nr:type II toxin-antitoxin system RelE/ParE family toxin [Kaistia algarum]MCX5512370.1 type II toxin-antitoxin system RelE/ParE family toxin [Kaistia algarum]PPE80615.1 peptidase [Kaistia algarum]